MKVRSAPESRRQKVKWGQVLLDLLLGSAPQSHDRFSVFASIRIYRVF